MLQVYPIPAFRDNYIWLIRRGRHAAIVDPGDATPVLAFLETKNLEPEAVLVTHHHDDHIGGIPELLERYPKLSVYAPRKENYAFGHIPVGEGDVVELDALQLRLDVMETPGHTLGHVVYYGANSLFCGDTLFSCGCGRLFEGTPEQLYNSLQRLAELPPETQVYCTHEYTLHNIRFARHVDPDNPQLIAHESAVEHVRAADKPSLPSTIAKERALNPFLRCNDPDIRQNVQKFSDASIEDALSTFRTLRQMRNTF